jgi:hypothetical protein
MVQIPLPDPKPFRSTDAIHLVIYYCHFGSSPHSHVGLGVTALHTTRVLRREGIRVDVYGINTLEQTQKSLRSFETPPTHVLIEAPWFLPENISLLMAEFQSTHFVVRCHSQIAFLQADQGAIARVRDYMHLEEGRLNFSLAANNSRLSDFVTRVYKGHCLYLPNLYDYELPHHDLAHEQRDRILRVGSFGALRVLKNHLTSAAASLLLAESLGRHLEFHISTVLDEDCELLSGLRNLLGGMVWARLVEHPWQPWSYFRRVIASMDVCMQLSFTESFNISTADAAAEGIATVTSTAVAWVPPTWKADSDDAQAAADVGARILANPNAANEGREALATFVRDGIRIWKDYLTSNPT